MSATRLFDAGYTRLVSVVPPDGALAPTSRIKPDQRGKCPGWMTPEGWGGYQWIGSAPTRAAVARWEADGANVGLQGEHFPGLDIDCDNKALAEWVQRFAEEHLGAAPVRLSRPPRRLLVYRTETPFPRMALRVAHGGKQHLVEMLGAKKQYLVHGRHPSGVAYQWAGVPLWDVPPDNLAVVTPEGIVAFLGALAKELEARGFEVERLGSLSGEEAAGPADQDRLRAPSMEQLTQVVELVPNPEPWGWDEYIEMGYAIRAAAGEDNADEAFHLWSAWSAKSAKHDVATDEHEWPKIRPPCKIGWTWLQEQAARWSDYCPAVDEFEADPELAGTEPPAAAEPERKKSAAPITLSDEWAVEQVFPLLKDRLRYVPGSKLWYVWGGYRWEVDERMRHDTIARAALAKLAFKLKDIAGNAPTAAEGKPFLTAAKKYQSNDGIGAVVNLLRSRVAVLPVDFDTDPLQLNTPGGVVDLRTGELSVSTPAGMFARAARAAPALGPMPLWTAFLHDLTGGDLELESFLQRLLGYCLTGDVTEKILAYAWGSNSDTGKSTLIRTVAQLLGNYHDSVDVSAFIGGPRGGDRVPADLARLPGARLVTATEPAAGQSWDEKRIKSITGGDEISARFLYGQWFTYSPQFKILIVGNHEPELRTVDDALVRRMVILPVNRKVPRERQIENLSSRMVAEEGAQIMAWLVEGCKLWQRNGLALPAAVQKQTKRYVGDQDLVQTFMDECCELGEGFEASRHDLYSNWRRFCREMGEEAGGERGFKGRFHSKADLYDLKDTEVIVSNQRRRGYKGIRLRPQLAIIGEEFNAE